ncbi:MAG: bifunctional adenosylcobinamide kinase/adenosylcobinamide-phosphate guanylyltransferase [Eubacteriales bacterium]|nr:bifunctional adenosylcobinamide kinase/adenosylcobinamide-phosphate guanylyltransferase [Eubacteriales bacterium]
MKFIIGGAFQGKTQAACSLAKCCREDLIDGRICGFDEPERAKGIFAFHEYIRRRIRQQCLPEDIAGELFKKNPDLIIISDEIGYGIVPVDREDRLFREQMGRIGCQIAALSDTVVRVTAGIPVVIKGEWK